MSDSVDHLAGDDSHHSQSHPFDDDTQQFDSVNGGFVDVDSQTFNNEDDEIEDSVFVGNGNDVFVGEVEQISGYGDEFSEYSDGDAVNGVFVESDGPMLPEIHEEGVILREWMRQNAILLEQKAKAEKEILTQIIEEATAFKIASHEKRRVACENNKVMNREREKLFLANHEKFHKEADRNYWKSIAELIPNEVPMLEKKGKKDQEKKPSIVVIQGPKPGKPTDLSRLRHVLLKLKHEAPQHLKLSASAAASTEGIETSSNVAVATSTEVAVVG
ncbi:Clathrin light chain 2-like protein [Drosera capensis]